MRQTRAQRTSARGEEDLALEEVRAEDVEAGRCSRRVDLLRSGHGGMYEIRLGKRAPPLRI